MGTVGLAGEATDGESRRRLPPSPASLSDARASLSAAMAEAGAQRGPRHCLGRASVARGPPFLRAGPAVAVICFIISFCFIISQIGI